jgi:type I restriction enzyme R subunit
VELKGTEGADLTAAFNQIETYKSDIPDLFRTSLLTVISDGLHAKYGSLSAGFDRFMQWRTVDGETMEPPGCWISPRTDPLGGEFFTEN